MDADVNVHLSMSRRNQDECQQSKDEHVHECSSCHVRGFPIWIHSPSIVTAADELHACGTHLDGVIDQVPDVSEAPLGAPLPGGGSGELKAGATLF